MTEYTPELHAHLKELHTAASPAPWVFSTEVFDGENYNSITDANKTVLVYPDCADDMYDEDSEIIIEARNALPALLSEIERVKAENKRLKSLTNTDEETAEEAYTRKLSLMKQLIQELSDGNFTWLQSSIWCDGYEAGAHNTIHASSIERGNETPETNPYKEK